MCCIGKRVDLIYDAENINIYYGLKLVTIHQRDDTPYTYTQKEAHGLPGHHGSYEKDLEEIYQRAGEIDSIQAFLKIYNEEKKYDYVMIKAGDNLLIANPEYDITAEIVEGLNKRYKGKPAESTGLKKMGE